MPRRPAGRLPKVVDWKGIPVPYNERRLAMPTPYSVQRFNALVGRGNVDLEVWFSARPMGDVKRDLAESSWHFKYRYLPAVPMVGRALGLPLPLIKGEVPDIFVSGYDDPAILGTWLAARARGARAAFWIEKVFGPAFPRRRWREALKRRIVPWADGIITVGQDGRQYAQKYGADDSRIHFARHGLDLDFIDQQLVQLRQKREALRSDWGLQGVTYIAVGRLFWAKGLNYLLDAFREVQLTFDTDTSLLIVGSGPEEGRLRELAQSHGLHNVRFIGYQTAVELPAAYVASDVFVFPTLGDSYGLVIDEAMACGLPVISTDSVGEVRERVIDGANGYVVPPADSQALGAAMLRLAQDPTLRRRFGQRSSAMIAGHTIGRWAEDYEVALYGILSMPRA